MAFGTLPAPGKIVRGEEIGPCIEPCKHLDCAATRKMADSHCPICRRQIGYEMPFYSEGKDYLHRHCYEYWNPGE